MNEFLQLGASQVCLFLAKPGESEQDLRKRPEVVSLPRCNLELLDAQISAALRTVPSALPVRPC